MIDIHTHRFGNHEAIVNTHPATCEHDIQQHPAQRLSLGLHPLDLRDAEAWLPQMEQLLTVYPQILFVGEIGIDKRNEDIERQISIFEKQMQIADNHRKAVIIHCVRAVNEILAAAKPFSAQLIFHGFRGKTQVAKQIIDSGHYISLNEKSLFAPETVKFIPDDRLFLETDDSSIPIEEIYEKMAWTRQTTIERLQEQIAQNFKRITSLP